MRDPDRREEARRAWVVGIEIFDDDGCFRDRPVAALIAKHRHLRHWPDFPEIRGRFCVSEIDDHGFEGNAVFIQRDESFMTEGGKRMEIELERHQDLRLRRAQAAFAR